MAAFYLAKCPEPLASKSLLVPSRPSKSRWTSPPWTFLFSVVAAGTVFTLPSLAVQPPITPKTSPTPIHRPQPAFHAQLVRASRPSRRKGSDLARLYFADEQLSFEPPQGFTAMGPDEIAQKFPGVMPPQYVYASEGREGSIGISLSETDLATEQLPEAREFLVEFLEAYVPGFQWIENDIVAFGGSDWIKLEFLSQDGDTQVHNDLYITSLDGKLLGFNFNATAALNPQLRPLLEDSRNSIQIQLKKRETYQRDQ